MSGSFETEIRLRYPSKSQNENCWQAIVKVANISHGLYAAELEGQGRYVVFELFDSFEPMLGDQIAHPDLCAEGNATFSNLTQGCEFDVFVQAVCEPSQVNQLCHL